MASTIITLILFVLLLVTLELLLRADAEAKRYKEAIKADHETYRQALEAHQRDIKAYRTMLADARNAANVTNAALLAVCETANEDQAMHKERIKNLCEQLEQAREARHHYYNTAAANGSRIHALEAQITELKQANYANLSGLGGLSSLQQENKLDALCEVIKTLMQRDQLCDAAVASFGGRLSRAVQVYRKDRAKAVHSLIPGLALLMADCDDSFGGQVPGQ